MTMASSRNKVPKRSSAGDIVTSAIMSTIDCPNNPPPSSFDHTVKTAAKARTVLEGDISEDFLLGRVHASNCPSFIEEMEDRCESVREKPLELMNEASESVYYVTDEVLNDVESGVKLNSKDISDWSIDELLKEAVPSTYGDMLEGTTKVNQDVRKALEIPCKSPEDTARGLEAETGIYPWLKEYRYREDVRKKIERTLFDGKPVEFKLNKLNIYQEGGFFSRHVDTPAENVVGTLLVVLNQFPFSGGEFRLGSGVEIERDPQDVLTLVAFYADVPHSVEPVTGGQRVTLAFYITKGENWDSTVPKTYQYVIKNNNTLYEQALKSLLNTRDHFGILLGHQYSIYETDGKGEDQPLLSVARMLKEQLLIDFEVHSVVLKHEEEYYPDEVAEKGVKVFRCDPDDWNYLVGVTPTKPLSPDQIPIYHCGGAYGETLSEFRKDMCEWTGNSAEAEVVRNVYFSRVVVIEKRK